GFALGLGGRAVNRGGGRRRNDRGRGLDLGFLEERRELRGREGAGGDEDFTEGPHPLAGRAEAILLGQRAVELGGGDQAAAQGELPERRDHLVGARSGRISHVSARRWGKRPLQPMFYS